MAAKPYTGVPPLPPKYEKNLGFPCILEVLTILPFHVGKRESMLKNAQLVVGAGNCWEMPAFIAVYKITGRNGEGSGVASGRSIVDGVMLE